MSAKTTIERPLSPFEHWMARSNLKHIPVYGLETVLHRLRRQGYIRVANRVQELHDARKN